MSPGRAQILPGGGRVDFEHAKEIGDEGEQLVAAELERLAPAYGMTVLHDVLLSNGRITAQLDHVVVDRYGVLILESKVRRGALIKGNDVEKRWTACYPGRQNKPFQNPLAQNREHENAVRKALRNAGSPLSPDYVKSAVVIVGANLSQLDLDSLSRARVVDIGEVEDLIRQRHDFSLNAGDLGTDQVASLAGLIRGLNRSGDAEVAERHAFSRGGAPRAATQTQPTARPEVKRALPSAPRRNPSPVKSWAITVNKNASRPTTGNRRASRIGALMVFVAACALLGWLFFGPGQSLLTDMILSGFRNVASPASSPSAAVTVPTATVQQGQAALLEFAPEVYSKVANLNSPEITHVAQGTTFKWEYVESGGAKATVKTVALTLDADGLLVGVDMR